MYFNCIFYYLEAAEKILLDLGALKKQVSKKGI